jgi:hypothetical protein
MKKFLSHAAWIVCLIEAVRAVYFRADGREVAVVLR